MTFEAFLEALRQCAGQYRWAINDESMLRAYHDPGATVHVCECPITAVAFATTHQAYRVDEWESAALAIDLPLAIGCAIVGAADDDGTDSDGHLRRALLEAVGLEVPHAS